MQGEEHPPDLKGCGFEVDAAGRVLRDEPDCNLVFPFWGSTHEGVKSDLLVAQCAQLLLLRLPLSPHDANGSVRAVVVHEAPLGSLVNGTRKETAADLRIALSDRADDEGEGAVRRGWITQPSLLT